MEYGLKVKQNANGKNIINNASIKYYDENIRLYTFNGGIE